MRGISLHIMTVGRVFTRSATISDRAASAPRLQTSHRPFLHPERIGKSGCIVYYAELFQGIRQCLHRRKKAF